MEKNKNEQKIVDLYNNGDTITSISKLLNLPRKSIYRILERNEVKLKEKEIGSCIICLKQLKDKRRNRCDTCNTAIRRLRIKQKCVEYKGGRCSNCGLVSENVAVYDFHHLDPTQKDFEIQSATIAGLSWENIVVELNKCKLLCSNCHRLEHSKYEKYKKYLNGDVAQ